MNKREWGRLVGIGVLTALAVAAHGAWANGASAPGSVDDPLVTKSYVDAKVDELRRSLSGQPSPSQPPSDSRSSAFAVVELRPGDALIGQSGTEIIIRSPGRVYPITSAAGGLSDLSAGVDRQTGPLPMNHFLIVPRSDGRGIYADPNNRPNVVVMVRGAYEIRQGYAKR
jgi:hypothetical protein|nr:hypothetical protein [Bacillota bacterium]